MSASKTIKKIMLDKDVTVKALAEKLGVSSQVLSNKLYRDTFTYKDYIKIADLNLITAIMDGNKMVGFGVTFSSFSKALQKTRDGHFLPFGWWHLLKILKWHKTNVVDLLLIGVLPEYRAKGANALIFDDLIRWFQRYGFEWA